MKKLIIQSEGNGHNTFAIPGSDSIFHYYNVTTADIVTVPAGARFVLFAGSDDFFCRWGGGTAVVPAAALEDGNGSELNPVVRSVLPGDTFSIIAALSTTTITVSFYN